MFSFGYCYGGADGKAGYRPEGSALSAADAQGAILGKLAGHKVEFRESNGKFRAYADGSPTGYIYFPVNVETWVAIDETSLGSKGEKALIAAGPLVVVKNKVREYLEKTYKEYGDGENPIQTVKFNRTGDNFEVEAKFRDKDYFCPQDIVLVRVSVN